MNLSSTGMDFPQIFKCVAGIVCIVVGLFNRDFKPNGWTSRLIWGTDENARTPRWIAGPVFVGIGLLIVYRALTGK